MRQTSRLSTTSVAGFSRIESLFRGPSGPSLCWYVPAACRSCSSSRWGCTRGVRACMPCLSSVRGAPRAVGFVVVSPLRTIVSRPRSEQQGGRRRGGPHRGEGKEAANAERQTDDRHPTNDATTNQQTNTTSRQVRQTASHTNRVCRRRVSLARSLLSCRALRLIVRVSSSRRVAVRVARRLDPVARRCARPAEPSERRTRADADRLDPRQRHGHDREQADTLVRHTAATAGACARFMPWET